MTAAYRLGLHDLGDGCHAWLQPDGSWGWSNAGLIVGATTSVLVDTLFDLRVTQSMLDAMAPLVAAAPIDVIVNTHSDTDHWFGNQLVEGAEIVASTSAARMMGDHDVERLRGLKAADGPVGRFAREVFAPFDWQGVVATPPTRTFDDRLTLDVDGTRVELIQVGPAHTSGDVIVHVPSKGVLFSGDILFVGGTPVVWAGPVSRWIAACDLILELDPRVIVPGHGPLTDANGVKTVRDYLAFVDAAATDCFQAGLDVDEAIAAIDLGPYAAWPEHGRLAQNVRAVYRELDPQLPAITRSEVMAKIAHLEGFA